MAKIKKILKKALPLAVLGLGAAALGRKRATDAPGNAMAKAKRLMTSDKAYSPVNKGNTAPMFDYGDLFSDPNFAAAKGGRAMKSKGGRVTGAAKRGFGRALMKGKK
jgi:hypothetical protein